MQLSLDASMERTFGVGEFGSLIGDVLTHAFPHDVWIQGEVRDLRRAQSGHVYFTIVDPPDEPGHRPEASLAVVLFESTKRQVNAQIKRSGGGMRIEDGVAIRIRATPDFYPPQGRLSLRMTGIDPAYTIGLMAASRDQLLRTLHQEGLLTANRSVPFPRLPLRIGLITAAGSAAQADFLDELARAGVGFNVVFAPSPVQGVGSAVRIAAAIRCCERAGVDVVAVVRGGGARTDLVAFDAEVVARTIAGCSVPVITGIGHEIDTSVADEVSHMALKTPTACAAHLVACAEAFEREAESLWAAIGQTAGLRIEGATEQVRDAAHDTRRHVTTALRRADAVTVQGAHRVRELASTRLDQAAHRLAGHAATARLETRHRLATAERHVAAAGDRADREARRHLADAGARMESAEVRVRLLDPARVLARGWSITTDGDGRVIRSVVEAPAGSTLVTRVGDGHISSTVDRPAPPITTPVRGDEKSS